MQRAYRPEPGIWFFKSDYRLKFDFSSRDIKPFFWIWKWGNRIESPEMVMYFQSLSLVLLYCLELVENMTGHFMNTSFSKVAALIHSAICRYISHEQWEEWRSQELSESEGHDTVCAVVQLGASVGSLLLGSCFRKRDADIYFFYPRSALFLEL